MDGDHLLECVRTFLGGQDHRGLLSALRDPKWKEMIMDQGMELVSIICECGMLQQGSNDFEASNYYAEALIVVAEYGNPKEIIVSLFEQLENMKFHCTLPLLLLPPIKTALLRLPPEKRLSNFLWLNNSLNSFMDFYLSKKSDFGLNGAVLDENCQKELTNFFQKLIHFYKPFVEQCKTDSNIVLRKILMFPFNEDCENELMNEESHKAPSSFSVLDSEVLRQKSALLINLANLLRGPLFKLKLNGTKSFLSPIANSIVSLIYELDGRHFDYLFWMDVVDNLKLDSMLKSQISKLPEELDEKSSFLPLIDASAILTFFYLTLGESKQFSKHQHDFVVFHPSPLPFFERCIYLFNCIIETNDLIKYPHATWKMVVLIRSLLQERIKKSLCPSFLSESDDSLKFLESICNILIFHEDKTIRQETLVVLKLFIVSFDQEGRYQIITRILKFFEHTGLHAFVIGLIKDFIKESYTTPVTDVIENTPGNKVFMFSAKEEDCKNCKLCILLKTLMQPENDKVIDIVKHSEKILAILNTVRFLLVFSPTVQFMKTDSKCKLYGAYLETVTNSLDAFEVHYKQKLNQYQDKDAGMEILREETKEAETCFKLAQENNQLEILLKDDKITDLPEVTIEERIKSVNSALNLCDLIRCVLSRVNECSRAVQTAVKMN